MGDQKVAVIDVRSSNGIGSGTVRRTDGAWPVVVVVRLNVRSLEFFKAGNGIITVEGWLTSKFWHVTPQSESRLPATMRRSDDSIEVTLPDLLFQQEPKEIKLEWIDAYR